MNKAKKVPPNLLLWIFILGIAMVVILAFTGCIVWDGATTLVLAVTLIAIIIYTKYTYEISKTNSKNLEIELTPILTSELGQPETEITDGKLDFKTQFCITNHAVVHAVAKINFNAKLDGTPLKISKEYSGEEWWYLPAKKTVIGVFSVGNLLESSKTTCQTLVNQNQKLTLEINVTYKRWSQKEDSQLFGNPPEEWQFGHYQKSSWIDPDTGQIAHGTRTFGKWIYKPTTFNIQFPTLQTLEEM